LKTAYLSFTTRCNEFKTLNKRSFHFSLTGSLNLNLIIIKKNEMSKNEMITIFR